MILRVLTEADTLAYLALAVELILHNGYTVNKDGTPGTEACIRIRRCRKRSLARIRILGWKRFYNQNYMRKYYMKSAMQMQICMYEWNRTGPVL
jgi:hypothetical protein